MDSSQFFGFAWVLITPETLPKSLILGANPRTGEVGMGIAKSPKDELSFCLGIFPSKCFWLIEDNHKQEKENENF